MDIPLYVGFGFGFGFVRYERKERKLKDSVLCRAVLCYFPCHYFSDSLRYFFSLILGPITILGLSLSCGNRLK